MCGSSPREWGTHPRCLLAREKQGGSSPREWGTLSREMGRGFGRRFIPTRVGNTQRTRPTGCAPTVHPHASGEHPRRPVVRLPPVRFIPTRVGNTRLAHQAQPTWTVHPHASGEHRLPDDVRPRGVGSSPREWGTRPARFQATGQARFIPTRVGNTKQIEKGRP